MEHDNIKAMNKRLRKGCFLLLAMATMLPPLAFGREVPPYSIVSRQTTSKNITLVVNYLSVNADFSGVDTLSGFISFPSSLKAKAMLLDNHHTITSNAEAPSVAGETASYLLFKSAYCLIAPDYLGYGVSAGKTHPYLCQRQNARNSTDFALVAMEIFKSYGVQLQVNKLYNIGYSQGGGVALAVQREVELDDVLAAQLHFGGSWCGDGPYDELATFDDIASGGPLPQPFILPVLLRGLIAGHPQCFDQDIRYTDYMNPVLLEAGLEYWIESMEYNSDTIVAKISATTGGDFSLAALASDGVFGVDSLLFKQLRAAIATDPILDGWKPKYPLVLVHTRCDEMVPFVNAERAVAALGLDESEQYFPDNGQSHVDFVLPYFAYVANALSETIKNTLAGLPTECLELPEGPMYDLYGRRTGPDSRGVVVQYGKKIMNRF